MASAVAPMRKPAIASASFTILLQQPTDPEPGKQVESVVVERWQRQLRRLTCPLKFENGRLFRRLRPAKRGAEPIWEEDVRIQPEERWLSIPEVLSNSDFEEMLVISAVVFLGVVGVKHQCRPATDEDLQEPEAETEPLKEPTGFSFGQQRFHEFLVEVMGA